MRDKKDLKTIICLIVFIMLCSVNNYSQVIDTILPKEKVLLYVYVDKLPSFFGGAKKLRSFVKNNLKWPNQDIDIQGAVLLSFIIDKSGNIKNIQIEKSLHVSFDREAKRVFEMMPKWKPGELNGEKIDVKMYFPIDFALK